VIGEKRLQGYRVQVAGMRYRYEIDDKREKFLFSLLTFHLSL